MIRIKRKVVKKFSFIIQNVCLAENVQRIQMFGCLFSDNNLKDNLKLSLQFECYHSYYLYFDYYVKVALTAMNFN